MSNFWGTVHFFTSFLFSCILRDRNNEIKALSLEMSKISAYECEKGEEMALQLIIGTSGSGKTRTIFDEIIQQSIANPDNRYLLIVPEQSTMELQREIIKQHPCHATMNIDVVSFPRLAYHIFSELKFQPNSVLDDLGKSMVLQKIMEEKKDELSVLGKSGDKTGFIQELKSLISEFYQYNITVEQIEQMLENTSKDTTLSWKLQDLKIILQAFETYLQKGYCTTEQVLQLLSERMEQSKMIGNSYIYLDEFTGYTPAQYELIGQLYRYAKKVTVSVTIDPQENFYRNREFELFSLSKTTIQKLEQKAKETNTVILPAHILPQGTQQTRFSHSPELAHLEKYLFRYPYSVWEEDTQQIQVSVCHTQREEAEYVASTIQQMIIEQGYRYREIAVVTGDMNRYQGELEKSFQKRNMAYFIDSRRNMFQNPCVESIRATMEMIHRNFSYESVFRYLKAGLTTFTMEEISLLENYVIAFGIRGYSRWNKPFVKYSKGMTEEQLETLNGIRERFIERICQVRETLASKKPTVQQYVEALYDFMVREQYEQRIIDMAENFENQGETVLAKNYRQIYSSIIQLLDQTVELMGDIKLPLGQLSQILDIGLDQIGLGVIPPSLDHILVGDVERSRFHNIKVLFFMGMNEGIVPKPVLSGGILTETDRNILLEQQVELAPTARQSISQEQFYLYLNVTKPEQQLIMTCSKVGTDGKAMRPSYFIGRLKTIFSGLKVEDQDKLQITEKQCTSMELTKEYMASGMRDYRKGTEQPQWIDFYGVVKDMPEFYDFISKMTDSAFYENQEGALGTSIAKALYGKNLHNSVSRIEKYASCAFAHYMRYGLGLEPRQEYAIRSLDIGNVLHRTVELFSGAMSERPNGWKQMEHEERDRLVDAMVDSAIETFGLSMLDDTKRDQYMRNTIARIAKRTIWAMQQQIVRGQFMPHAYELEFMKTDQLNTTRVKLFDDVYMELSGKIDRIDRYEDDENIYLKIVDYKSGSTSFSVQDMNYGLQIQLVVYLNAAMELEQREHPEKKVIPAGIFYFNMKDPMISRGMEEYREMELLDALKMNGLAINQSDIIELMEAPQDETFYTLPVKFNKDGSFAQASRVASKEMFAAMGDHVNDMVHSLGQEIMEGQIAIAPYALGQKTACDYCDYRSICNFDERNGANSYRRLKVQKEKEVLQELLKKEEGRDS